VRGKPANKDEARMMIKEARSGASVATAFCLDRKVFNNGAWQVDERIVQVVTADYVFDVPDAWLDIYLEKSRGLVASGAIAIEEFGSQFLKTVHGSYTTIVGLPMYELREALEKIGFFVKY
jgi:septum formation protein